MKTRSTKEIDLEAEAIKGKIKKLEAEKKRAAEAFDKFQTVRKGVALDAFTGDDKAQRKLEKARADQVEAQLKLEDIESAISEAHQRLHALEVERQEVFRAEKRVELAEVGKLAVEQSGKIDETLIVLVEQLTEHVKTLKRLQPISAYLGHTQIFSLDTFRRCLHGRLHKTFRRDFECYANYRNDFAYAERLKQRLEGVSTQLGRPEPVDDEQDEFNPVNELGPEDVE